MLLHDEFNRNKNCSLFPSIPLAPAGLWRSRFAKAVFYMTTWVPARTGWSANKTFRDAFCARRTQTLHRTLCTHIHKHSDDVVTTRLDVNLKTFFFFLSVHHKHKPVVRFVPRTILVTRDDGNSRDRYSMFLFARVQEDACRNGNKNPRVIMRVY